MALIDEIRSRLLGETAQDNFVGPRLPQPREPEFVGPVRPISEENIRTSLGAEPKPKPSGFIGPRRPVELQPEQARSALESDAGLAGVRAGIQLAKPLPLARRLGPTFLEAAPSIPEKGARLPMSQEFLERVKRQELPGIERPKDVSIVRKLFALQPPKRVESIAGSFVDAISSSILQVPKTAATITRAILERPKKPQITETGIQFTGEGATIFGKEVIKPEEQGEIIKKILNRSKEIIGNIDTLQNQLARGVFDDVEGLNTAEEFIFVATGGAVSLLESVAIASVAPSAASVLILGALESSDTFNQALDAGKTPNEARVIAGTELVGTGILESIGGKFFLGNIAKGSGLTNGLVRSISGGTFELAQEELQTIFQNSVEKLGFNKTKGIFDGMFETLIGTLPAFFLAGVGEFADIPQVNKQIQESRDKLDGELKKLGIENLQQRQTVIDQMVDFVDKAAVDVENKVKVAEENLIQKGVITPEGNLPGFIDPSKFIPPAIKGTRVLEGFVKPSEFLPIPKTVKEALEVEPRKPKKDIIPPLEKVDQIFKPQKFKLTEVGNKLVDDAFKEAGLEERTVKKFSQFEAEAKKIDIDQLISRQDKAPITPAENVALTNFVNNSAKRIAGLNKLVTQNPAFQFEIDQTNDLMRRAIQKQVKSGTELGRAVAAFRIQANLTLEPFYWLRQAQRQLGERDLPDNVVSKINEFIEKGERDNLSQFVANLGEVSWLEKLLTLRKAGLLTSLKTDVKNIISNTLFKTVNDTTDVFVSTPLDFLAGLITKKRTVSLSMVDALKSWSSFGKGAQEGLDIMRGRMDNTIYNGGKIEYRKSFNRFSENKIERALAVYTENIFNRLEAEDKPFKAMAFAKSIREQAKIKGREKGLKGDKLENFITKTFDNPTSQQIETARQEALNMTFQAENMMNDMWRGLISGSRKFETRVKSIGFDKQGKLDPAKALGESFSRSKIGKIMAREIGFAPQFGLEMVNPFAKVATNLFTKGIQFTPAGFMDAIIRGSTTGQRDAVRSASRAIMGSLIIASLFAWDELDDDVEIKLRSLEGSKERRLRYRKGEQVGAVININGFSINLQSVDPIPTFFLGAGIASKINDGELTVSEGALEYGKARLDETYVQGIKDMVNILNSESSFTGFIKRQAASFVPTLVFSLAKSFDNKVIGADSIIEAVIARLPIARKFAPQRLDAFGRETEYNKDARLNAFNQLVNPFVISRIEIDDIDKELERLNNEGHNVLPSETGAPVRVGGETIKLTQNEINTIQKIRGENIWNMLTELFKSEEYIQADDNSKSSMIRSVTNRALTIAKTEATSEIIDKKDIENINKLDYFVSANPKKAVEIFNSNEIDASKLSTSKQKTLSKWLFADQQPDTTVTLEGKKMSTTQRYSHMRKVSILKGANPNDIPTKKPKGWKPEDGITEPNVREILINKFISNGFAEDTSGALADRVLNNLGQK